ncbi:DUF2142 domain-containing protein [Lactovum odontotermitis]
MRTDRLKKVNSTGKHEPGRNIHKFYLLVAVFCGILLSVFMPLYNEPDGQYHFVTSTAMMGVAPDISRYGEVTIGTGFDAQTAVYKNGNFVDEYYKNEIVILSKEQMRAKFPHDPRDLETKGKFNYNYWGHVIPAFGAWLGYKISPTLGMMATVGRLFSMFVYSLLMAVIIKFLKFGKLLFATVSLSPVMLNSFSSFSYDSLGYVLVAAVIMLCINSIAGRRVSHLNLLGMLLLIPLTLISAKPNLFPVLLMIPLTLIYCQAQKMKKQKEKKESLKGRLTAQKERYQRSAPAQKLMVAAFLIIGLAGLAVALFVTAGQGGLINVLQRLFFTFDFRFYMTNSPGDAINILASPYPTYNYTPTWMLGVWFALLAFVLIYEKSYHASNFVSLGALFLLIIGVLGTYYYQLNYGEAIDNIGLQDTIQGVQGRYHTPLLMLLSPALANSRWSFRMRTMKQGVVLAIIGLIAVFSNFMLIYNTLYALVNL